VSQPLSPQAREHAAPTRGPGGDITVAVDDLHKSYGATQAVAGISLQIARGEVFGILGPNGAGKTTLLECVVGLRRPTSGSVRVLGLEPRSERRALLPWLGVQPQEASLFPNATVLETLELWRSFYGAGALDSAAVIEQTGLQDSAHVRAKRLSGGQRQRLLLGLALVPAPEVLILDEPSAGLDPHARHQIWETIRAHRAAGQTVLLTTHGMEEAQELCDRVAIIERGKLVALDTPDLLVAQFASQQWVVYETAERPDEEALCDLDGVDEAHVEPAGAHWAVRIGTRRPEAVLQTVLSGTGDGPSDISLLRVERGNLEDVFLELTGRSIDEDGKPLERVS